MVAAMSSPHANCHSDDTFGPVSCTRPFDFTLTFEQSILSILFSAIMLLVTPPRLFQLSKRKSRTVRYTRRLFPQIVCGYNRINPSCAGLTESKLLAVANSALQITLHTLWCLSPSIRTSTSVPSATLSLIVAITMMGLLYFETDKATTPSTLLIIYLLFSVLFDAAQIRTLWLAHYTSIAAVQTASIAVRTCLLVLESQSKASYLRLPYRDYPPEAQSGILNTSFVWWLNQLFIKGFRKLMTTSDLFALHPKLSSEILGKRLKKYWNNYGTDDKGLK